MHTVDGVEVVHDLRVWLNPYESGTVDLRHAPSFGASSDMLRVHVDAGKVVEVSARTVRSRHTDSGQAPPLLPKCQWVLSCTLPSVRMQPHPLMSPVPVCARHVAECGLT